MTKIRRDLQVRWLIRRDLPFVLAMDNGTTEEEFLACLRNRNCIGQVVEDHSGTILGYMQYELCHRKLSILRLFVAPECRNRGSSKGCVRASRKLSEQP